MDVPRAMNASRAAGAQQPPLGRLRRYLRSPKGQLLVVLAGLIAVAGPHEGLAHAIPTVIAAVVPATLLDFMLVKLREGVWIVPDSAVLSGLIIGMILSSREPWTISAATGLLAI